MPAFQWQAPPLPNEGTITDLLLRGPEAIARAAERSGEAQAQAQANSGHLWGQAINAIGQTAAAVPQQMQASQQASMRTQAEQLQLDSLKRDAKSRFMLESALKNPANRKDDGSIDTEKVTTSLRDNDVGAWQTWQSISAASSKNALDLAEKAAMIDKTVSDTQEKRRQFAQAQGDYLGRLAFTAIQTLKDKPDDPLHARDVTLSAVARAAADGAISEPDAKQFLVQTASATPARLTQLFGSFVPPELRGKLEKEAADTAKAQAEAGKATAEATNLAKFGRPTPPSLQRATVMLDGKPNTEVLIDPNPAAPKVYDLNGQVIENAAARVKGMPPASIQIRNEQTAAAQNAPSVDGSRPDASVGNKVDPRTGRTPNAIYQGALEYALLGKMPSIGLGSAPQASNTRADIQNKAGAIAAAAGVDLPTVQAEYRANSAALSKLLPQAQATANFANTATDNLDLALKQSDQVARSGSKLVNRYAQWVQGNLTPAAGLTQFETYVYTAAREYAKVTSGGAMSAQGLTDSAQREASKLLNTAQAPEAFAAAVAAMKNDMANVISEQAKGLGRVSSTIANFFSIANGGGSVTTPSTQTPTTPLVPKFRFNPKTMKLEPIGQP